MTVLYTGVPSNIASPSSAPAAIIPVDGDPDNAATFSVSLSTLLDQVAFLLRAQQLQGLQNLTAAAGLTIVTNDSASDGASVFVIAAGTGTTAHWFSSPDAKTWTARSGTLVANPVGIIWVQSLGLFIGLFGVVGGVASGVETSPDGVTWTNRTVPVATGSGVTSGGQNVAFGTGIIVAAQGSSQVMSSPDGINWTVRGATQMAGQVVSVVVWSGSQFIAVSGTSQVYTSPDGLTWTSRGQGGTSATAASSLSYNPRSGVTVLLNNSGANFATTTDGITWTNRGALPAQPLRINYAAGRMVSIGTFNSIFVWMTSEDGITWTKGMAVSPQPASAVNQVRFLANDRAIIGVGSAPWAFVSNISPLL